MERNSTCSTVAIYISNKVDYIRRGNLEGSYLNIIIIDLVGSARKRIINLDWLNLSYGSYKVECIKTLSLK